MSVDVFVCVSVYVFVCVHPTQLSTHSAARPNKICGEGQGWLAISKNVIESDEGADDDAPWIKQYFKSTCSSRSIAPDGLPQVGAGSYPSLSFPGCGYNVLPSNASATNSCSNLQWIRNWNRFLNEVFTRGTRKFCCCACAF